LQYTPTKNTNFSNIFTKKFLEEIDAEQEIKIKGCPKVSTRANREKLVE